MFEEILVDPRVVARRPKLAGWGINDAPYVTQPTVNGRTVKCPYYAIWSRMIYNAKKTGATVSEDWRHFMKFRGWAEEHYRPDRRLDKDVLVDGNKVYSPATCAFVTPDVVGVRRSVTASGVDEPRPGRFRATCGKHIGYFRTKEAAHSAWVNAKRKQLLSAAWQQSDIRVTRALLVIANEL